MVNTLANRLGSESDAWISCRDSSAEKEASPQCYARWMSSVLAQGALSWLRVVCCGLR